MDGLLNLDIDSFMDVEGRVRVIDVDNRVVIPAQEHIRALITSRDVIHS
jgi:heme/copper-type cytochrome/quinol oxidase subunit 2